MASDRGPWIQTFTGRQFHPLAPLPEDICLEDIAHALSCTARFGGHTTSFYSVAQHSVLVAQYTPQAYRQQALLHDASEAYLGDMPRPLKHSGAMEGFRDAEMFLSDVIAARYGLYHLEPPQVKTADSRLLVSEKRDLMPNDQSKWSETEWLHGAADAEPIPETIIPWEPYVA